MDIKQLLFKLSNEEDSFIDGLFHKASIDAERKIDCLSCAMCCKTISPIIEENEIQPLSQAIGVSTSDLFRDYVEMDEDGDFVFNMQPCPMLDSSTNLCKIYEHRPRSCREYPHTNTKGARGYFDILEKNHELCPIVQEVVKNIEVELNNE